MKKHSGTILLVLIFFVGLAVMLYPTISDYINQRNQTRVVNSYAQQVDGLSDADYTAYFDAADVFNQKIAADPDALYHADRFSTYSTTLDVTGTGIMGYITIPRIGVELPIYHGTSDAVLQVAAGHLEGTSLPVGGESTHAVISAHRGLPSAKLFTHLDRLEVGDTFTITVLDRELTYEVDKISIVLPTEVDELKVVDGKDYVTLMTCTPYGINTHRLLVRGHRVTAPENLKRIRVSADATRIEPILIAPLLAVPLLLLLLIGLLVSGRKRKQKWQKPPGSCYGPGRLVSCGNVQRAYCWACSARLAPISLSSGVLKKSFLPSAKGPCMQPGGLYDVPCMEEHLCQSCPCGTRRDPGVHSTSATATSLTFVPVAPVRMSPPTACKAW